MNSDEIKRRDLAGCGANALRSASPRRLLAELTTARAKRSAQSWRRAGRTLVLLIVALAIALAIAH